MLIVSNTEEAAAATKIVGDTYEVMALEGGALAEPENPRGRECLLWLDPMPEPELTALVGLLYMAKARSVAGFGGAGGAGFAPRAALAAGADLEGFQNFLRSQRVEHPRYTPQILEDSADDECLIEPTEDERQAWRDLGLRLNSNKVALPTLENAVKTLRQMRQFEQRIWFDDFVGEVYTNFGVRGPGAKRQWIDADSRALQLSMQENLGLARIGFETVHQAVLAYAHMNRVNPPKDWLLSLQNKWDGVSRIGGFLQNYMGAENSEYTAAVSKNFFIALVARIFRPGCKVDNMLVLEGSQGRKKSTALKALGGEWFTECNEPLGAGSNKDFYAILRGKMIVEIAELDSFSKADTARIKAIITTATDRYRAPYAKVAQEVPRTSVFVGTTNEDEYLADPTGGRRFWPVKTGHIDADRIAEDREQLFAEAVCAYRDRPVWWELPLEEARALQDARRRGDVWEECVRDFLLGREQASMLEVIKGALKLDDITKIDQRMMNRVSAALKVCGWVTRPVWDAHTKKTKRAWVKK